MFFITYLRRELRGRLRQAIFVALGLALGVGLAVTVTAASAGVDQAESAVLSALYGVGTDLTVTGQAVTPLPPPSKQTCTGGQCATGAGHTYRLIPSALTTGMISASTVAAAARLHDVSEASGVLTLIDQSINAPANPAVPGRAAVIQVASFSVDGVPAGPTSVGPLAGATISSGHSFTAAESDADVALVDAGYAASTNLKVGSAVIIKQVRCTVIGIVSQPPGTSPPDVYIPLARAQALATLGKDGNGGSLADKVNLIYVAAATAADIPAVQTEISRLLPGDTVTAASSLASQVTGSLSGAAKLASDFGRWLSVLVLIAAFAGACLLTMAAVARRSGEFGTLKALGWPTPRITAQVLGESAAMGVGGAAAGVGLGFAGAAIIAAVAPKLSATDSSAIGSMQETLAPQGSIHPFIDHSVLVPLSPSITAGWIVLAVLLAAAGGLLAGAFGSWQIARLRPADALAQVA
jgi:putative ABC transport system permease protein